MDHMPSAPINTESTDETQKRRLVNARGSYELAKADADRLAAGKDQETCQQSESSSQQ